MRLKQLYTNLDEKFEPVTFNRGLNFVLAEIRLPENQDKDIHNLGKSTLGDVIDFCLLKGKSKSFFLFKHPELFEDFVFYLEIQLEDDTLFTIRRSVADATKISFKKHNDSANLHKDPTTFWDHEDVAFDRAKNILDSTLNLSSLKPWAYRNGLGYLIRGQDDYTDIFKLAAFQGAHSLWKPFLAQTLGFEAQPIVSFYEKEKKLAEEKQKLETIQLELAGLDNNSGKVEGMLQLRRRAYEEQAALLEQFNFNQADLGSTEELVDEIDVEIAGLNKKRYSLKHNRRKISAALKKEAISFDPEKAKELFKESNVFFDGQLKKDFEQLIKFNKAITTERRKYLREELSEVETELTSTELRLEELSEKRANTLAFLSSTDVFQKYKEISEQQVQIRADIESLERQKEFLSTVQKHKNNIRELSEERDKYRDEIEEDVATKNSDSESRFSQIRFYFNEIVNHVIDRNALLSVGLNQEDHLEFAGEILDEQGRSTSASAGNSYRKLLCVAFDLAVLRSHLESDFFRFAFHDGVFDSLDPRKKTKLLSVLREYASKGLQLIVTTLDSELPPSQSEETPAIKETEVVVRLHDEGAEGRLFKVASF